VLVAINASSTQDLSAQTFCESNVTAVERWHEVTCSALPLGVGEITQDTKIGYDPTIANKNLVVVLDSGWPYDPDALALTSVTISVCEAKILDADMEINSAGYVFTTSDNSPNTIDLLNTLVHEYGHLVGLDHSNEATATMFPTAPPGEISKRDLTDDDRNGICAAYPSATATGQTSITSAGICQSTPTEPASGTTEDSALCSLTTLRPTQSSRHTLPLLGLFLTLGLVILRRQSRHA